MTPKTRSRYQNQSDKRGHVPRLYLPNHDQISIRLLLALRGGYGRLGEDLGQVHRLKQ
jgi:hypothetical protein